MSEDFSKDLIKDYRYWSVYVNKNQSYLGRCIVWCKRNEAKDLSEATVEEQEELFLVLKELRLALQKTFQIDWLNYSFLGNETRHLHAHVVPRYSSSREFSGMSFTDKLWGHNYLTDHNFITPPTVLGTIKDALKKELTKGDSHDFGV